MKKNICTMLCLLLSVLLLFTLAACQDSSNEPATMPSSSTAPTQPTEPPYMPASAAELWGKVETAMDALESMESTGKLQMVYYYMGYEFVMESANSGVITKDAYCSSSEATVTCAEASLEQVMTNLAAYYDGKMYIAHNDGTFDQKLCSTATMEQFLESQTGSLIDEVAIAECTGGKFTKNGEEGWSLEFSGYTKKSINQVLDVLELDDGMLGAEIEDFNIKVEADANFCVKSLSLSFVFAEEDGAAVPEFTMSAEYSKYNTATFDPEMLKAEEYVEVADLFVLDMIADGLKERQDATSGNFVLDITSTTTYYGQTSKSKETDIVTYGKKNGAYYYAIDAEDAETTVKIVYQNGVQTVTADGETYTAYSSDADAKAMVDDLIDSAFFNAIAVTNIEKEGDGVYMLTLDAVDLSVYSARVAELGITLESGEQAIKVTFKDGKIAKIESLVCLAGKYEYNDIEMDLKNVVDFEKEADYPTV